MRCEMQRLLEYVHKRGMLEANSHLPSRFSVSFSISAENACHQSVRSAINNTGEFLCLNAVTKLRHSGFYESWPSFIAHMYAVKNYLHEAFRMDAGRPEPMAASNM